tara:strand:- start:185 stop:1471 length:1287 start_codon:yes stop_codon:yes gene_type:complete
VDVLIFVCGFLVIGLVFLAYRYFIQGKSLRKIEPLLTENQILKDQLNSANQLEEKLRLELQESNAQKIKSETLNIELRKDLESNSEEERLKIKQMYESFENIANKILDKKSSKFTQKNKENLELLLEPLDKDIRNFRKKIEEMHEKDISQHASLKEFLKNLQVTQNKLSQEAQNLTTALKGDTKKQGDWGEFILERTLEASGLVKGVEFSMQQSFDHKRPDAIIYLPENKSIIVDSKVSLTAYERYISSENDEHQRQSIKEHLISVKKHVDELSKKDYSSIEQINSPDFVLLFIPIEPAFGLALREDKELYQYAFDRKIVLVTSTTLMATIKTVANLWKLEKQNKNANDIANRAGLLYDKFVGFIKNLDEIGDSLQKANAAHEKAIRKLSVGSGNLLGQVSKLQKLGVRTEENSLSQFNQKNQIENIG